MRGLSSEAARSRTFSSSRSLGYVSARRAPAAAAALAIPHEIDRLFATPTIRPVFPARVDMSVFGDVVTLAIGWPEFECLGSRLWVPTSIGSGGADCRHPVDAADTRRRTSDSRSSALGRDLGPAPGLGPGGDETGSGGCCSADGS